MHVLALCLPESVRVETVMKLLAGQDCRFEVEEVRSIEQVRTYLLKYRFSSDKTTQAYIVGDSSNVEWKDRSRCVKFALP